MIYIRLFHTMNYIRFFHSKNYIGLFQTMIILDISNYEFF